MSEQTTQQEFWKREEIRGLFVLGVITTILGAKDELSKNSIHFGEISIPISTFTLILLVYWGLYALLMVFAVSDDVMGSSLSDLFRSLSNTMLDYGAKITIGFFIIFMILGNVNRIEFLIVPTVPSLFYFGNKYLKSKQNTLVRKPIIVTTRKIVRFSGIIFLLSSAIGYAFALINMISVNGKIAYPLDLSSLTIMNFCFNLGGILLLIIEKKVPDEMITGETTE